jgi:hypothetical protein
MDIVGAINWGEEREEVFKKVFSNSEYNQLYHNSFEWQVFEETFFIKFNTTTEVSLEKLIGVNFKKYNVLVYTPWAPNLLYLIDGKEFMSLELTHEGILFDKNVIFKIKRTTYNEITPVYFLIGIVNKNKKFHKSNLFRLVDKNNLKIVREPELSNATYNDNFCIFNNKKQTTICLVNENAMMLREEAFNLYHHPYVDIFIKRFDCNVISMRYSDPTNFAYKYGVTGYKPTTFSAEETVEYIKQAINLHLPTTKQIITVSWCAGVFNALYLGLHLNAKKIFLFERFIQNLNLTYFYKGCFEEHEYPLISNNLLHSPKNNIFFFYVDNEIDNKPSEVQLKSLPKNIRSEINVVPFSKDKYYDITNNNKISNLLEISLLKNSKFSLKNYI